MCEHTATIREASARTRYETSEGARGDRAVRKENCQDFGSSGGAGAKSLMLVLTSSVCASSIVVRNSDVNDGGVGTVC